MNKKKNYPLFVLLVIIVIILISLMFKFIGQATDETEPKAEPLVIDIPEPTQEGKITVFNKNSEIVFDYQGDFIKIVNNGKNGEPIVIEVHIPYEPDSCFQEGDDADGQ